MSNDADAELLKIRYEKIAKTLEHRTTASDFQLRELEIEFGLEQMRNGDRVLDVGCGLGYAVVAYATQRSGEVHGIDYAENMIKGARKLLKQTSPNLKARVDFRHASILELPYPDGHFNTVTSSRCLMALLDWDLQKKALREIHRVMAPGGTLALMEGTLDGLEKLNEVREQFDLEPIAAGGRDRLLTRKFREAELLDFCKGLYDLKATRRFGMYYFLTRVVQPLLVHPEKPSYDHKINQIARNIARLYPDFNGIGHLVAFAFHKTTG